MYNARKIFRQLNVNLTTVDISVGQESGCYSVSQFCNPTDSGEKLPSPYLVENFFLTNNPN